MEPPDATSHVRGSPPGRDALRPSRREGSRPLAGAQAILALVEAHPGITLGQVRARLDLSWGAAYHHVLALIRRGEVHMAASGRRRLLFATADHEGPRVIRARALLAGESARRVALAIREGGARSIPDLRGVLRESDRVLYYHVRQLVDAGLVVSELASRRFGLRTTPLFDAVLPRERVADAHDD